MTKPIASQRSSARRWLERLLLFGGLAAIGVWGGSKAIPALWQAWENRVFDQAVRNGATAGTQAPSLENGRVLGRLSIPRLHLSSIVREGDDETTLSLALGHIPSTVLPGQTGNVGVAGHRDTIFRSLQGIHKNDLIQFETLAGTHVYEVDSMRIVKPDDVAVLRPRGTSSALTLVTCYPFYYVGSAPDRFIVSAHEVPAAVAAALPPVRREPAPQRTRPVALRAADVSAAAGNKTTFQIRKGHGQEVAPGISLGVTDTNPESGSVYGWMWVMPDRRTVLLRDQPVGKPLVFYRDGQRVELRILSVSENSILATLVFPVDQASARLMEP